MVYPTARFNDTFNSFDLRLSREFHLSERFNLQAFGEVFNLFNKTNILGASNANYSGFFNVLVPDQGSPNLASAFGRPASGAGGVFGTGGPRAFQFECDGSRLRVCAQGMRGAHAKRGQRGERNVGGLAIGRKQELQRPDRRLAELQWRGC